MEILAVLIIYPLSVWGVARGMAAWAQRRKTLPSRWAIALGAALGVPLAVNLLMALVAATQFQGQCSGWSESGSHACSLTQYLLQDFELGLVLLALPTLVACVGAYQLCWRDLQHPAPRDH